MPRKSTNQIKSIKKNSAKKTGHTTEHNYTRRMVHGASVLFLMGILASFSGYLLQVLLARALSPNDFGLVYAIFSLFGVLLVANEFGLRPALSKFIASFVVSKEYGKIKGAFFFVLLVQVALSILIGLVVILLGSFLSTHYFHTQAAYAPLIIYSIGFMIHSLHSMFKPTFQGFQFHTLYSLVDFLKITTILVLTALLLPYGFGVSAPMIAYLVAYLVLPLGVYLPLLLRKLRHTPKVLAAKMELSPSLCKKIFLFGLPLILGEGAGIILGYSDTLVLAYFSLAQVGLYNIALPISKMLWRITTTLTTVFFPMASELWARKDTVRLNSGLTRMQKYALITVFPLAILIFFYAETIIQVFFGSAYVPAANALRFLVFGAIFYTIAQLNMTTLLGIGHPLLVTKLTMGVAVWDVIGNLVFIPAFGMMGAVLTTVVNFALLMVLSGWYVKKYIHISFSWLLFFKITAVNTLYAGFIFLVGRLLSTMLSFWPTAIIVVSSSTLFYFIALFVARIVSKEELFQLWHRIRKN